MKKQFLLLSSIFVASVLSGCRPGIYFGSDSGQVPLSGRKQPVTHNLDNSDNDLNALNDLDGNDLGGSEMSADDSIADATYDPFDPANGAKRWSENIVYFSYNSQVIPESEYPKVNLLVDYMKETPNIVVLIEGHCDSRGSDEYNRSLGNKRANSILDYLVAAGISQDRITVISKGEEVPAVADAQTESEHAKNRRGEFVIGAK